MSANDLFLRVPGYGLRRTSLRPVGFQLDRRAGPCTPWIDGYGLRPEKQRYLRSVFSF